MEAAAILDLVAHRDRIIEAASIAGNKPLFVRVLRRNVIDKLFEGSGAAVAILNPENAFAAGGARNALEAISKSAMEVGATRLSYVEVPAASYTLI